MKLIYPLLLLLVAGITFAVTAEDCWDQTRPCAISCCPSMGGTWSDVEDDCMIDSSYTDDEVYDLMDQHCPTCFTNYMDCMDTIQDPITPPITPPVTPPITQSTSNCCAPAFLLGAISIGAFLTRRE
ncbi:MAG: hypothetical protein ABID61_03240 [Candidatus Micrarchaeota archaeon]